MHGPGGHRRVQAGQADERGVDRLLRFDPHVVQLSSGRDAHVRFACR
ncbi:hypothetical protein X949_5959 [Burkholderia pseudomallei MSHR5609]|nr:hypothetical protein X949_5959 [Burkholderia pseudomallei MSHR5609]